MTDQLSLLDYQPVPKARRDGPATQKRAARLALAGPRHTPGRKPVEHSSETVDAVKSLVRSGLSAYAIANQLGLGRKSLSTIIKRNQIEYKTPEKRQCWVDGNVAYVPLTLGYTAVIDAEDLHIVEGWNWAAQPNRRKDGTVLSVYAARQRVLPDGRNRWLLLHRAILNPDDHLCCDHIDGDGLNNRRSNLRIVTKAQNNINRRRRVTNTSGVKGVSYDKQSGKWAANIGINGKNHWLGRFDTKELAAAAYAEASARLHKEFGRLE
jgi:hypothetical protein